MKRIETLIGTSLTIRQLQPILRLRRANPLSIMAVFHASAVSVISAAERTTEDIWRPCPQSNSCDQTSQTAVIVRLFVGFVNERSQKGARAGRSRTFVGYATRRLVLVGVRRSPYGSGSNRLPIRRSPSHRWRSPKFLRSFPTLSDTSNQNPPMNAFARLEAATVAGPKRILTGYRVAVIYPIVKEPFGCEISAPGLLYIRSAIRIAVSQ